MASSLRTVLNSTPMRPQQWFIVGVCTMLNALDGFDVLAMAFTASAVSNEFGLSGAELGMLLSSGLIGMAVGAIVLSPLADKIGRRPVLIASAGLATVGMLLTASADSATMIACWRIVTGLGVGGILAGANIICNEYASDKHRGLAISIYTAGYGIGAGFGGMGAAWLLSQYGWHSVFIFGGVLTGLTLLVVIMYLPESVDFLETRRDQRSQQKLLRVAKRLNIDPELTGSRRTETAGTAEPAAKISDVLIGHFKATTLLIWVAFFATMFAFYFVNSWTPRLLVVAGMTEQQGVYGGIALTLGGALGSVVYGVLCSKWTPYQVMVGFVIFSAATMVGFISSTSMLFLAFALGVLVGMLVNGCVAGLYTITPASYPAGLRGTGVGAALGVGRLGAIIAPTAIGALLDGGWTPQAVFMLSAAVLLIAGLAIFVLRRLPKADSNDSVATEQVQEKAA